MIQITDDYTLKFIAHRGLLNGPDIKKENTKEQIVAALQAQYFVEIDMWKFDDNYYISHDNPFRFVRDSNKSTSFSASFAFVEKDFLERIIYSQKCIVHCKNYECFEAFYLGDGHILCDYFSHDQDEFTVTGNGKIWFHPNSFPKKIEWKNSVMVLPEWNMITQRGMNDAILKIMAKRILDAQPEYVCTDYVIALENTIKNEVQKNQS